MKTYMEGMVPTVRKIREQMTIVGTPQHRKTTTTTKTASSLQKTAQQEGTTPTTAKARNGRPTTRVKVVQKKTAPTPTKNAATTAT